MMNSNRIANSREAIDRSFDQELTLGPVGPLRHMGVVVARHSTQLLLPSSATPIPTTYMITKQKELNQKLSPEHTNPKLRLTERAARTHLPIGGAHQD